MPIIKYKDGKEVGRYADRIEAKKDLKVKGQIINLHLIGKLKLVNGFVLKEVVEEAPTVQYIEPVIISEPQKEMRVVEVINENAPIIPTDFHLTKFEKLLKRSQDGTI